MNVFHFEIRYVADNTRYIEDPNNHRPENEVIVLHGSEKDAASQLLRGVVVLCLPAPLSVEGVYLQMTGNCRIGWVIPLADTAVY
jgi:hypothetical protein